MNKTTKKKTAKKLKAIKKKMLKMSWRPVLQFAKASKSFIVKVGDGSAIRQQPVLKLKMPKME